MDMQTLLQNYEEAVARRDVLQLEHALAREHVLAPVQAALDTLDAEHAPRLAEAADLVQQLEEAVREAVLAAGQSARGQRVKCTYVAGRVTWDSKLLEGMMIVFPDLAKARREGKPSVRIGW